MQDLFSSQEAALSPLADRMRPRTLDEFIGQGHIVGPGRLLRRAIEADRMTSSIFYGPPGCGKTTLASIIAGTTHSAFVQLNAVTSGVADVRQVIKEAQDRRSLYGQATYLLLDECHRWSKSQSDSILPAIERGVVRFIGSTTENPLVSMTPAIVSRCRIFQFYPLSEADVILAMRRALADRERGFGATAVEMDEEAMRHIARIANGDVRSALGALELAVLTTEPGEDGVIHITMEVAEESIQKPVIRCDESLYYDMLSAFCKSLRGSDADAEKGGFGPVPIHLRDTHYAGHERLGSGAQYQYPHDFPGHWVKQEYMPPEVKGRRYYIPSDQGQELKLRERRKLRGIIDP